MAPEFETGGTINDFTFLKPLDVGEKLKEDREILKQIENIFYTEKKPKVGHLPVISSEPYKDINIEVSIL